LIGGSSIGTVSLKPLLSYRTLGLFPFLIILNEMFTVDISDNVFEIDNGAASTDILHGRIRPEPIDVNDCAVGQELTDGPPHMDLPEGKAYLVTNLRSNLFTDSLNHLATRLEIDMQEGGYPRLSGPPSQLTFYELTL